jgi:hypothetical protein
MWVRNMLKCVLSAEYYWHDCNNLVLGKCDDGRPRGRGRFILENSIEVDVKEIMYVVTE